MNDFTAYFTYAEHVILKIKNVMIHTRSFKSFELKSILRDLISGNLNLFCNK